MLRRYCHTLLILLSMCLMSIDAGKKIEGIFSKKLIDPGYYTVTSIPEGAKSINVTEISRTVNFLAVKLRNGSYLFNEDYNIASSGKYKGAGTTFVYIRHNEYNPETFYAAGPIDKSVDVLLIYHNYEPKVLYQYELPDDYTLPSSIPDKDLIKSLELEGSSTTNFRSILSDNVMMRDETRSSTVIPKRKKRRRYTWKAAGFTNCSKPCGGGFQTKRYICIGLRTQIQVSSKKCESLEKPKSITVRCSNSPCAPQWQGGPWSKCSVTCGNGTRKRELYCIKQMPENLQIRERDHFCESQSSANISLMEPCYMPDCNLYTTTIRSSLTTKQQRGSPSYWKTEEWSTCSTTCGNGTRIRIVVCVTAGKTCDVKEKPATREICNLGDCKSKSIIGNEIPEAFTVTSWLYSAWPEQCSSECGTGTITRRLYCENSLKNDTCDEDKKPVIYKVCFSNQVCGQWFIGPWSQCSSSCDVGIETREVACVSKFFGILKVVNLSNCPGDPPETIRGCKGAPCNATWFMSDWTHCSRSCGRGVQKRDVLCVGSDGVPINATESKCHDVQRPAIKRHCNVFSCNKSSIKNFDVINDAGDKCRDIFTDCWKIRRETEEVKHKCQMEFYKKGCCKACRSYSNLRPKE